MGASSWLARGVGRWWGGNRVPSLGAQQEVIRALLIVFAGLLMTIGCSHVSSPAEHQGKEEGKRSDHKEAMKQESPAKLAKYHVTKKETCQIASQNATCYSVSTDATSGEDFTALTQHLRKRSGGVDTIVITFYLDEPKANSTGKGFAFKSREVAHDILSRSLPKDADLDKEVGKAMQNDGVYVISIEDEVEQRACDAWDSKSLGPPPEQWDCAGY
jgi:hypothetical protein